ncbi:MAG: sugar phosphate isomerase/epimerase [bacterium]|nr:sugar phosphate isomerase/epimerase [bacterium]
MRISMWTSYFIEYSPEKAVEVLAGRGWRCAELSDEHGWALLERGQPARVGAGFRRFAGDLGFTFPQGHLYLSADIAHHEPAAREKIFDDLKLWLELFVALGIEAAVLHPGGGGWPAGADEARIEALRQASLERLLAHLGNAPLAICLENCPGSGATLAALQRMLAPLEGSGRGRNLGICLDTGHLNLAGGGFADFIRGAGGRLKALHVADNLGIKDDHMLPYGKGTVPWDEVMRALKEIDYAGLFNFEVGGERECPEPVKLAKLDYARTMASWMVAGETPADRPH